MTHNSAQFGVASLVSGLSAANAIAQMENHAHFMVGGDRLTITREPSTSSRVEKDPLGVDFNPQKVSIKKEVTDASDLKVSLSGASEKEIWSAVRERILSHYGLWDILIDKAVLRYTNENDSDPKDENARRFQAVVQEVEALLGEFKCFMDACLVRSDPLEGNTSPLCIGPELTRAYQIPPNVDWKLRATDKINYLYRPFFHNDKKEEEFESEAEDDDDNDSYESPESPEIHEDLKPNICVKCNRSFPSVIQLQKHEKNCKPKQPPITANCRWKRFDGRIFCKFGDCEADFDSVLDLWNHFQENHALPEEFNFKCGTCQACFVHPEILKRHRQAGHTKGEASAAPKEDDDANCQYQCPQCTRRFKSRQHIEKHLEKCKGIPPAPTLKPIWEKQSDGRFTCAVEGCDSNKSWTSSFSVWYHFNTQHASMSDEKYCVFKCDLCDDKFPTRSMLNRHKNHKHEELFRFQCSKCPKKLPSNKLLKIHMIQHTGEKPYSCEYCDYKAISQSIVVNHALRMHEEFRKKSDKVLPRHVCDICGKSFNIRSNLKEHIATHSDARSFLCGVCGKSLKNRQCLNRHLFTHGVKQTCQICNRNFANVTSLGIHQREKHGLYN